MESPITVPTKGADQATRTKIGLPGVYKNQKIDPASIMAALSRTEAGFLVSAVDFPSVRNLETEPE